MPYISCEDAQCDYPEGCTQDHWVAESSGEPAEPRAWVRVMLWRREEPKRLYLGQPEHPELPGMFLVHVKDWQREDIFTKSGRVTSAFQEVLAKSMTPSRDEFYELQHFNEVWDG